MSWLSNKLNLVYFRRFLSLLFCFLLQIDVCFLPFNEKHPCRFHTFILVRIITILYPIFLPRCCKPSMSCCVAVTIASNYMIRPFCAPFCVLSAIATGECTFTRWIHTWLWVTYIKLILCNLCWWIVSYEKELKYINLYADRINFHGINFGGLKRNLWR